MNTEWVLPFVFMVIFVLIIASCLAYLERIKRQRDQERVAEQQRPLASSVNVV